MCSSRFGRFPGECCPRAAKREGDDQGGSDQIPRSHLDFFRGWYLLVLAGSLVVCVVVLVFCLNFFHTLCIRCCLKPCLRARLCLRILFLYVFLLLKSSCFRIRPRFRMYPSLIRIVSCFLISYCCCLLYVRCIRSSCFCCSLPYVSQLLQHSMSTTRGLYRHCILPLMVNKNMLDVRGVGVDSGGRSL